MWKYTFSDTGGYDCMTGAFHIWYNDKIIFSLDQNTWGQVRCDYDFKSLDAEILAEKIVNNLNEKGIQL